MVFIESIIVENEFLKFYSECEEIVIRGERKFELISDDYRRYFKVFSLQILSSNYIC